MPFHPVFGSTKPHSFQKRVEGRCMPRSFITAAEWGSAETPVYLTSTLQLGRVYDSACRIELAVNPECATDFIIPVVAECDDGWLNTGRRVQVETSDVQAAFDEMGRLAARPWVMLSAGAGMAGMGNAMRQGAGPQQGYASTPAGGFASPAAAAPVPFAMNCLRLIRAMRPLFNSAQISKTLLMPRIKKYQFFCIQRRFLKNY